MDCRARARNLTPEQCPPLELGPPHGEELEGGVEGAPPVRVEVTHMLAKLWEDIAGEEEGELRGGEGGREGGREGGGVGRQGRREKERRGTTGRLEE